MPIYEYRCARCGFQEEYLQKINDAPLRDCPECHEPELRKMVTAAGFQLKGTGWYATDFKGGTKPKAKEKPAEEAKPAKSDDVKAKPATAAG